MKETGKISSSAASMAPHGLGSDVKETSTVKRILLLLQCLVDYPEETAQSLAQRLNLPRSSVHRLLATLCTNEFARHESTGGFGPGLELYRMASKLGTRMSYRKLAESYLQELSAQFHETSILTLLERQQLKMFHAANGSPTDPMRYNIRLNALEPLVWGATARVLLAHLSNEEINRAIAKKEPSPVQGLIPDEAEINESLQRIRIDGYAITHSHRTPNTVGVAAPFFNGAGEVVGSLGFLIPEFRWTGTHPDNVVQALLHAAAALSRQLGYSQK
ncbi:IclR family transcriptional regulator [Paralcaligenes ureilyticus]|uniref:IclR family transcriptional regulator n=1 Tax=Paralcaligenes ureilyticus TaxID=627131 RepID=A0A4R3MB33_9BURK|nr:IclR family transcriptional regulator [Paralcaligenes ureilyticus]